MAGFRRLANDATDGMKSLVPEIGNQVRGGIQVGGKAGFKSPSANIP